MRRFIKIIALVLASIVFATPLVACSDDGDEVLLQADYGSYGSDIAREFASLYPYRAPYTMEEAQAGLYIKNKFEELGYEVSEQVFTNESGQSSTNYFVSYSGRGFINIDEYGNPEEVRRTIVIGAHYDDIFSVGAVDPSYNYDGISDNASGVGCLLTIAAQISNYEDLPFDVYLVAFGAGNDNFAGARAFVNSLTPEMSSLIDCMYCIDSIYGGDKVYASAGYNSLNMTQKYQMRRKLYQAYDVTYDSLLYTQYEFSLYYNESGVITDLNGDGFDDIYREVSHNRSDYVPFDELNIPIVYFDSADYFFDSMGEMKDSKNLNLQEFGGMIRNTPLDSCFSLDPFKVDEERDILQIRINCIAYIILESMMKGSDFAMTHNEYEALENQGEAN
ncbi:MAG: M28 family peptidase [Saccharofermentans sp.]|nr:M28 family peptidase [Saccharofermentans sp.]